MTEWITQAQAAELLGCHVSLIPKLIAKGELTSRGRVGRSSIDRDQVLDLRAKRDERDRLAQAPAEEAHGQVRPAGL